MNFTLPLTMAAAMIVACPTTAKAPTIERTVQVKAGQPTQIGVFGRVKPDCTTGPVQVRVVDQPDHGRVSERSARLSTAKIAGCPAIETPVVVIFYQSNTSFLGKDELAIEAETDAGQINRYHYTIDVQ